MVGRTMVKYGIRLATDSNGTYVSAKTLSKEDGPFTCVICEKELSFRAGTKTPKHLIHKKKSECEGNTDEHRQMAESLGSIQEIESKDVSSVSIPETKNQEPIVGPLPDLLPIEVLSATMDIDEEVMDPEVPDLEEEDPNDEPNDVAADVSQEIIDDALEFVVNEVLKETKCTDCRKLGSGYNQMFTEEAREKFDLNDLFVCDSCVVRCPACDGPNSQKRSKRNPICFTCDFEQNQWEEEANEAVVKMGPIPESPDWLKNERREMVIKAFIRKQKARVVYNFMASNNNRIPEYVQVIGSQAKANAIKRALKKERKESMKTRKRNEDFRNRKMGSQATERYNLIFANKKETCPCGKPGKRRHMVRYASTLGSVKYSCNKCSVKCPGCSEPCTQNDFDKYLSSCFECLAWTTDRTDVWRRGEVSVISGCKKGSVEDMGALYTHGPVVTKGKFAGDRLVHVPTGELDAVIRRDHPEFKAISDVLKACRKM